MGYDYYVNGEILLTPALSEKALNDLVDKAPNLVLIQGGEEDTVGLVKGEITVIPGDSWTQVMCKWDEPFRGVSELANDLAAVAAKAKREGCVPSGALYSTGEDAPDLARYVIREDYSIIEESPKFVWANGDTGWSNGQYV